MTSGTSSRNCFARANSISSAGFPASRYCAIQAGCLPFACPFCAGQSSSPHATLVVMALIAVPFVVAALIVHAIRNLDR